MNSNSIKTQMELWGLGEKGGRGGGERERQRETDRVLLSMGNTNASGH